MEQNTKKPFCKIVVLGANGGIGKQSVIAALKAGHSVTAILRTPANLDIVHPDLQVVQGDIMKPGSLDRYLEQKDVVISAIGSNSLKKTILYSQGNQNLVDAMLRVECKRAFFISASGLEVNPTHSWWLRFLTRFVLQALLRNMYADLWRMEAIIKSSPLHWTIMRPPKLLDTHPTGHYRTASGHQLENGLKISRADVAGFMVSNLDKEEIFRSTVEIAY